MRPCDFNTQKFIMRLHLLDVSVSRCNALFTELPTNFTCSSNTVNVTAYNPYFENLGINYTELYLGSCPGTLSGDDILYAGECGALVEVIIRCFILISRTEQCYH